MALNPPDRASDRTSYSFSSDKPATQEYYTDYDKKTDTIMKKSDLQARDGWVSPWPQGHENYTEYVSPEEQTANVEKANAPAPEKQEYYTDYDEKSDSIMKKSDLQKRDGWVSPWPQDHPNYTKMA